MYYPTMGHAWLGNRGLADSLAARLGLTRQWLHARRLAFAHPRTGEREQLVLRWPWQPAPVLTPVPGFEALDFKRKRR